MLPSAGWIMYCRCLASLRHADAAAVRQVGHDAANTRPPPARAHRTNVAPQAGAQGSTDEERGCLAPVWPAVVARRPGPPARASTDVRCAGCAGPARSVCGACHRWMRRENLQRRRAVLGPGAIDRSTRACAGCSRAKSRTNWSAGTDTTSATRCRSMAAKSTMSRVSEYAMYNLTDDYRAIAGSARLRTSQCGDPRQSTPSRCIGVNE